MRYVRSLLNKLKMRWNRNTGGKICAKRSKITFLNRLLKSQNIRLTERKLSAYPFKKLDK
jgi:hypothetical protein